MSNTNNTAENTVANVNTEAAIKWERTNRKGRETLQMGGVGLNAFGSFCGDGINRTEAEFVNAHKSTLDELTINGESETLFHITESEKHGVHAGICERFNGLTVGEGDAARTVDILMKTLADGTRVYYTANVCKGFALVSDAELLEIAREGKDLRAFKQLRRVLDETEAKQLGVSVGSFVDGAKVKGALLRAGLAKDFNAVVYRTAKGLDVRVILTRKAKEHETEYFTEYTQIKEDAKIALASEIFDGVKVKKEKDTTRNAAKAARAKLAREAKKAAK